MTISSIFAALVQAFTHPHIDAPAAAAKLTQIQTGLETASAVVSVLPDGNTKTEALEALNKAAVIAGEAVAIAHTAEAVVSGVSGAA